MSDADPIRRRANDNPWYWLATVHGEQTVTAGGGDWDEQLAADNRWAWNGWMARDLSNEQRAILVKELRSLFARRPIDGAPPTVQEDRFPPIQPGFPTFLVPVLIIQLRLVAFCFPGWLTSGRRVSTMGGLTSRRRRSPTVPSSGRRISCVGGLTSHRPRSPGRPTSMQRNSLTARFSPPRPSQTIPSSVRRSSTTVPSSTWRRSQKTPTSSTQSSSRTLISAE